MKKIRKSGKKGNVEIDFWQSTSDMMTALILMLLLVILLLMLYLMRIPEHDEIDPDIGNTYVEEDEEDDEDNDDEDDQQYDDDDGGGHDYIVSSGGDDQPEPDDVAKAAVYLKLVDDETGQVIPQEGVAFELYQNNKILKILNTYYPERISYREYETTDKGVFFLPEKIEYGSYYFRNLSEVEGYDLADDTHFYINDSYDWPDPYVVTVRVAPSRNIIRIQMKDQETKMSVEGGSFDVLAAEDIFTGDGTLRYKKGEVVDEIICNENGYGESRQLYLGKYSVRQKEIPEYYAGLDKAMSVSVEEKTKVESNLKEVVNEKTSISLRLTDELYPEQPIEGAVFRISSESNPGNTRTAVTDSNGMIYLDELDKNTKYHLAQAETGEKYKILKDSYEVAIDQSGWIDGEKHTEIEAFNRRLRIAIGVKDMLMGRQAANSSLTLCNSDGKQLKTWTTSQSADVLDDLDEGTYYLLLNGNETNKYEFELKNKKEVQKFDISIWTMADYGILAALAVGGIVIILLIAYFLKKFHQKSKKQEDMTNER